MARVIAFLDIPELATQTRHMLGSDYDLRIVTASQLSSKIREAVRRLAPDVILLELDNTLDNAHIYFFLRADAATRNIPIIVLAEDPCPNQRLAMFCKDGCVQYPFIDNELYTLVNQYVPLEREAAQAA